MKKFILPVLIFLSTVQNVTATSAKVPLPDGFSDRLGLFLTRIGEMNTGLKISLILLIFTIIITVIFYLMRNVKSGK